MSRSHATIPSIIQKELDKLPKGGYQIARGGKHLKIYLRQADGSMKFSGILPSAGRKETTGGRGGLNVASNIKRHMRTLA